MQFPEMNMRKYIPSLQTYLCLTEGSLSCKGDIRNRRFSWQLTTGWRSYIHSEQAHFAFGHSVSIWLERSWGSSHDSFSWVLPPPLQQIWEVLWTVSNHHNPVACSACRLRLKQFPLQIIWIIYTPGVFSLASPDRLCYQGERAGQGWNKRLRLVPSELQQSKDNIYQKHTQAVLAVPKGSIDKCTHGPRGLCDLPGATLKQNTHRHQGMRLCLFRECCHSGVPHVLSSSNCKPAVLSQQEFRAQDVESQDLDHNKVPPDHQVTKVTLRVVEEKIKYMA